MRKTGRKPRLFMNNVNLVYKILIYNKLFEFC
nr:MAG TPA: hypothetical protein [Caudoviricetes sp.]